MLKKIVSLIISIFILLSLTACSNEVFQPEYNTNSTKNNPDDSLIAENDFYKLEWNSENMGVVLTEISSGKKWGTSPEFSGDIQYDDFGLPIGMHDMVNSVLVVEYHDADAKTDNIIYSYVGVTENGHINTEKIKNGLRVEYYFDTAKFMIPVEYELHDTYVRISVDPTKIQEENNTVTSVSLAPYWCSAENDSDDSYLFIPSGSGALAGTESVSAQGNSYSAQVYGKDASIESLYEATDKADINLPVYGAVCGSRGTFAIIDNGAETAEINATTGSTAYGHSAVYSLFQLRGYTTHQSTLFGSKIVNKVIYTNRMITSPISVCFYPLVDSKANYSGMAEIYRQYLIENNNMKKNGDFNRLTVEILGGTMITKSFLGIPYETLYKATSVSEAGDMVNELAENLNTDFTVILKGFGTTGIDIGKICGGYKISNKLGNAKELNRLSTLCKEKSVRLYMDFDLVRFNSSGSGFSGFFDNSTTAGDQKVFKQLYDKAVRDPIEGTEYKLLSPYSFEVAAEKLIEKTKKWDVDGICLSTLSSISYSDYGDKSKTDYYAKSGFGNTVKNTVKKIKKNNTFAASDANMYAAVLADTIINAPSNSSSERIFYADVPFYEMVFSGYVPMSVESLNLSENPDKMLLSAVESGCGIGYTVMNKWDNSLIDSNYPYFTNSVYSELKDSIINDLSRLKNYYDTISDTAIVQHQILENGVRKTVFDNGTIVYVNYNDTPKQTPDGEIAALNFMVLEGAE